MTNTPTPARLSGAEEAKVRTSSWFQVAVERAPDLNSCTAHQAAVLIKDALLATLDAEREAHQQTKAEALTVRTALAGFQRAIRRIVEADGKGEEWEAGLVHLRQVALTPLDEHEQRAAAMIEAAAELAQTKAELEGLKGVCRKMLDYRDRNTSNFQLEKMDDFLAQTRSALTESEGGER